ncbi:MAG: hypothetical protein L0Y72_04380 [Gemmataceae bacterium]|nr:hypothetical protein [Gemmataceae bacterium]MCI0738257.1 hypothetical protein [Gemmataceae bacterium]
MIRFLLALCIFYVGAATWHAATPFVNGQEKASEEFFKRCDEQAKRWNGALLLATASIAKGKDGQELHIHWSIDYNGPRPPFTILEPSLARPISSQTTVRYYAEFKDGKRYPFQIAAPSPLGFSIPQPGWFVTAEKGEKASGTLVLSLARIKERYQFKHGDYAIESPVLRFQLEHTPSARGQNGHLDAWTGQLFSKVVLVPIKNR